MERNLHPRHIPYCETRVPLVDQYSWPEKDTVERVCENGISHAIYACNGNISRTLPLSMYPLENTIHPDIRRSSQPHFGVRDPFMKKVIELNQLDKATGRLEGLYIDGKEHNPYEKLKQ